MIVRESIKSHFERGGGNLETLRIGKRHLIVDWLERAGMINYNIDEDFTIWTKESVIAQDARELFPDGRLPEYIKFKSSGDFDVDDNALVSLVGFPEYIAGYFSCQMNHINDLEGFPKEVSGNIYFYSNQGNITEEEILAVCNARQGIEMGDDD